jgi:AraC-like DNA-binding protein/tetratricopeptide (TPR) repeat protein
MTLGFGTRGSIPLGPLPRGVRKAIECLESQPGRAWRVAELARTCGIAPRTLQKQFRRFVGRAPLAFLCELRLARAREELVHGRDTSVTEIAMRYGFAHLGRFAVAYRHRYGESPSDTLRRPCAHEPRALPVLSRRLERPTVAIVFEPAEEAVAIADEIAVALWRLHWIDIVGPARARYHLRGTLRARERGARLTVMLSETASGRLIWAASWDDHAAFAGEERIGGLMRAIEPALRAAEIERAMQAQRHPTSWDLTLQALPCATSVEAAGADAALELLERAIALAPHDPLPIAIAAWCHGLRAGHHFTARRDAERAAARALADRAARLNSGDALAETMLAAGYTLAHDLDAGTVHAERALLLDGGSAWGWGRSAWIKAYRGEAAQACEQFRIARALAPTDSLNFLWAVGIASTAFQDGRYEESIRWYRRALAENPASLWIYRFLAPACMLAGRRDEGRSIFATFNARNPDLTIADVRAGLPWNARYLDRVCDGLESAGMRCNG